MKRFVIVAGIIVLIGAVAVPVMAHGPGMGRGRHMMGYGGGGPGYSGQYDNPYGNLTDEQRSQLEKAHQSFFDETVKLRNEIWSKKAELSSILYASEPDTDKAKSLQKEISDLKAQLAEKRLDYEIETRKIVPEGFLAGGYGRGYGRHRGGFGQGKGYGMHMGGYGQGMGYGMHRGGYGQGACWNY